MLPSSLRVAVDRGHQQLRPDSRGTARQRPRARPPAPARDVLAARGSEQVDGGDHRARGGSIGSTMIALRLTGGRRNVRNSALRFGCRDIPDHADLGILGIRSSTPSSMPTSTQDGHHQICARRYAASVRRSALMVTRPSSRRSAVARKANSSTRTGRCLISWSEISKRTPHRKATGADQRVADVDDGHDEEFSRDVRQSIKPRQDPAPPCRARAGAAASISPGLRLTITTKAPARCRRRRQSGRRPHGARGAPTTSITSAPCACALGRLHRAFGQRLAEPDHAGATSAPQPE